MIKALILAGGSSSGLLPLTISTPKPLLPVANFPLLLFQIDQFKKAGVREVILSLAHQPRKIRDSFGDGSDLGILLRYHIESTPFGTAGALKKTEYLIDDTVVVINGDILTEQSLEEVLVQHKASGALVTLGVCLVDNPRPYGVVEMDSGNWVTGFVERPRGKSLRANTINAGVYVLEPEIFQWIPGDVPFSFERDLFPLLLERQVPFFASVFKSYWREITRPDNYFQTNMDCLHGRIEVPSFAAFPDTRQEHPDSRIQVEGDCVIDRSCTLKPGARISHSVIGSNCRIEEGARIRNSVLWPGCRIQKGAVVTGGILGRGVSIGEGATVRRNTILGDKSILCSHSKV